MGGFEEKSKKMMMVESLVCPKPRRLDHVIAPLQLNHVCYEADIEDSRAGAELLDIILSKGDYDGEKPSYPMASSPPFYCGSPPSRVSNPVIQDAQFGTEKINLLSPSQASPSSSSSCQGGSCVRMKFGHKQPAVRIEGFNCLSRDRRNCSISAMA